MKKIVYIVLYFGKLPYYFDLFLKSCRFNPTVDWIVFTDDMTQFNYPDNVHTEQISFTDMIEYIQRIYDFDINIDVPYKLCDFKVAYGEIFEDYIRGYDFWGYCDIDIIWGNIRHFITDDILEKYDKIGFQGHSTLYRNTYENNRVYRNSVDGLADYKRVFCSSGNFLFDETVITSIYNRLQIPQYTKTVFAHPSALHYSLYLKYLPVDEDYKNKHQILEWDNGILNRICVSHGNTEKSELMYFHIFKRKMKIQSECGNRFFILHHAIVPPCEISVGYIKRHSRNNMLMYYVKLLYTSRKKLRPGNIKGIIRAFESRKRKRKELKDRFR